MDQKKDIRKDVLRKRNELSMLEWDENSHKIYEKVVNHPFFLSANTIYCYVDYNREVRTREIIETAWKKQKKVAVPKIEGDDMNFYYINSFSDLSDGYRGILEPENTVEATDEFMLVIMPGVAFDKKNNRLGYGKGFYDRFLQKHKNSHTIALGFEMQIIDSVPTDEHDMRPEFLITEETIYDSTIAK